MVRQELIPGEGGFRSEEVDGAIVTGMELAVTDDGSLRAVLAVDDTKGLLSYRMGLLADFAANLASPEFTIPGFGMSTDFNKITKAFRSHGLRVFWDVEAKTWETEPSIIGKKITIKSVKTGSGKNKAGDSVDYHSLIDIVAIEGATPGKPGTPPPKPSSVATPPKGAVPDALLNQGIEIFSGLLVKPMTLIELNTAMIKAYPDEATGANKALRASIAGIRSAILANFAVSTDTPPKYSIPV